MIERRQRLFGDFIEDYLQPEHKILFKDLSPPLLAVLALYRRVADVRKPLGR